MPTILRIHLFTKFAAPKHLFRANGIQIMDMKRIGFLLLCSFCLLGVRAQQEGGVRRVVNDSTSVKDVVPPAGLQSEVSGAYPLADVSKPDFVSKVRPHADSLHLPVLNSYTGQPMM